MASSWTAIAHCVLLDDNDNFDNQFDLVLLAHSDNLRTARLGHEVDRGLGAECPLRPCRARSMNRDPRLCKKRLPLNCALERRDPQHLVQSRHALMYFQ